MIYPDVIKARYPEPPPKPAAWSGWRRRKGSDTAWELAVVGAPTKGACYQELMSASELVFFGDAITWEYLILPKGEQPRAAAPGEGRLR